MDKGKISVIIPCFNLEKYIEKTVQSVLNQTYDNLEIILVDDGSTDSTPQLIDSLAKRDGRVSAFHKQNGGVSSARLYGIERASGDWIAFVDGDDLLKPEMYTVLMDNAVRYNADISHCGYEMVFPDHTDKYYGTGKLVLQNTFEGLRDLLSGEFIEPSLANKLYKKEVILNAYEACAAAHNIRNMEDLLWNYYFFKRAKTSVFIDECYYLYVLRKGSATTSGINKHKLLDPIKVFRKIEEDCVSSQQLNTIVKGRKAAPLIGLATIETKVSPKWVKTYSAKARKILRRNLVHYLWGDYSLRLKVMVALVSFSPKLYAGIHGAYSKVRGTDRKYEI